MSKAIFCSITWQEKIFFTNSLFLFLEEQIPRIESSQTSFTGILGFSSLVKICLWILEKEFWRDKEGFTESFQFCWAQHEAREQNEWVQVNESSYIIYFILETPLSCQKYQYILLYTRVKSVGRIRPQILVIFQTICSAYSWIIRWISKSCINVAAEL